MEVAGAALGVGLGPEGLDEDLPVRRLLGVQGEEVQQLADTRLHPAQVQGHAPDEEHEASQAADHDAVVGGALVRGRVGPAGGRAHGRHLQACFPGDP